LTAAEAAASGTAEQTHEPIRLSHPRGRIHRADEARHRAHGPHHRGAGFFLAAGTGLEVLLLLHTLFGMGLVASGACGLNEYASAGRRTRMNRTADRPIPSGRIAPRDALLFSGALSASGWSTSSPSSTRSRPRWSR
jgi:hypothetical protein